MSNTSSAGCLRKRRNCRPDSSHKACNGIRIFYFEQCRVEHDCMPKDARFGSSSSCLRSDAGETSEPMESATLRVYEKLRQSLGVLAGVAGFQSLASRALALAKSEVPSLSAVRVHRGWIIAGPGRVWTQIEIDKDGWRVSGWRGRNHSHCPLTRPASYLPWRSSND